MKCASAFTSSNNGDHRCIEHLASSKDIETGNVTASIGGSLMRLFQLDADSKLLASAFERYATLTFPHVSHSSDGGLSSLKIHVDDLDESHPQLGVDESYNLDVTSSDATLVTVWGALYVVFT